MVGVVRTRVKEGDILVLLNPNETRIEEFFRITLLQRDKETKVTDGAGRVFATSHGKDLWIHPEVMIRYPIDFDVASKDGYRFKIEIHVNNLKRIHFANFLRNNKLSVFNQLPSRIKKEF